ncbi:hypothetical protein BpHYR1_037985 [Brachionus plicatilis]|uniref:Uncharacterized protein n=1 Tax=Brachionus plicatilis TaxID=10195 RepID=A0A3M7RQD9_BRAPC|nr:hypothetical protein BpHYR1_037985 [Brachionus plicatilis]
MFFFIELNSLSSQLSSGTICSQNKKTNPTDLSTAKWRCKVCIVKRELAKKSGCWSASVEARPDVRQSLLETLKKIKELEKQKKMEQQPSIEFSDIKRVKIKKFGLLAAAASKFNTNLYLRRHSQNSDGENSKIISLDEWRKKRNIENQETLIGDHDDQDDGDDQSKIGRKKFRQFSMNKQEQKSNGESDQMALLTKDLNDFIDRTESDENLANLAKVILIEHKRSLQMTQTMTQDSSISYNQSTDSRRDSFSSRQDSSISVHENESSKQASTKHGTAQKKNSNDWRQRRKNLMIRSKKWSNAFDEENQDSSLIITTDESFASNSLVENAESQNNSPIFHEDSSCSVHISAPEHSPQFQIRSSFCEDSETLDCENITTRKNTRKLPDLPTSKHFHI